MAGNQNPYSKVKALVRGTVPSMRYAGETPFADWQKAARAKLGQLLGLPFVLCNDKFEIQSEENHGDFTEIRFVFQSEEDYFTPCHLLIPAGADRPLPVAICLQGHSKGMHVSLGRTKYPNEPQSTEGDRDFAVRVIKEGFCALVLEQRNFGECGGTPNGPDCYNAAMADLLIGRTVIGERVWDVQRAIDVLGKHFSKAVDMDNIICMGNSGGGTATFYAACMEERIKYAMPSCSVCTYEDSIAAMHHCACNFVPNIRLFFDMGDLGGLIAPRTLVVVAGSEDDIFPLGGVKKSFDITRRLYEYAGAPDKCELVVGNGGHRFYADLAWPAVKSRMK